MAVVEGNDLRDVVLAGHSYSGIPVGQAAGRIGDRLRRVVYVDSNIPTDGKSFIDGWSDEGRAWVEGQLAEAGGFWPPLAAEDYADQDLSDEAIAMIVSRSTPHPGRAIYRAGQAGPPIGELPTTYIKCLMDGAAALVRRRRAARVTDLGAGRAAHRPLADVLPAGTRWRRSSASWLSAPLLAAASWPQAPSISWPRVSRTVVGMPPASRRRTNSRSSAGSDAVHFEPGVGLSGIRLTCTQPQSPRAASFSASRSARQAWSLMSRIIAYSIDTRRLVCSRVPPGRVEHLVDLPAVVDRHEFVAQLVVRRVQRQRERDRDALGASWLIRGTRPTVDTVTPRAEMPRPSGDGSVNRRTAPITAL